LTGINISVNLVTDWKKGKGKKMKKTMNQLEKELNIKGVPDHKRHIVGNRVKNYGTWLRKNQPWIFLMILDPSIVYKNKEIK